MQQTQEERRRYLLRTLLDESEYRGMAIPADEQEQKDLLRALMNIRPPRKLPQEFLAVQDAYLQQERDARGVVDGRALPTVPGDARLAI